VITDFGIAAIEGEEGLTRTGLVVGTLAYMAPELTAPEDDRRQRASSASDLWALGATLHTALTGYPPRPGAGAETGPELSASTGPLTAALDGLLRDDPAARITAEQAAALLRAAAGPGDPATPAATGSPSRAETVLGVPAAVPPAASGPRDSPGRGRDERTMTQLAAVPAAGSSGPATQAATSPAPSPATFPATSPAPAAAGSRLRLGIGLLVLGIAVGIASLFPEYQGFGSLASATDTLVTYSGFLVSWTAGLVLIVALRGRPAFGALLGLGTAAATLGVFAIDLSVAVTGSQAHVGPGLVLALLGWLSCTAGVALLIGRSPGGWPRRPHGRALAPAGLLVVAALGTAIAYGPTSFNYTWSGGSLISGDLYPVDWSLVTTANLFLMVIFVAAVIAAVLWVPARLGAAMAAGAIIPMAMQAVFTLVAVAEFVPPDATGDVTPAFKAYCAFIIAGAIGCGWLATIRDVPQQAIAQPEAAR
jgi:Protein kinase domain